LNPPPFSVILNPTAGARRGERFLEKVRALVQNRGGVLRVTEWAGHATALARKDQQAGITLVFAGGGDDTVREVIHGIFGSDCRLGILPLGTFNNLASSLLLPHHPLEALLGALNGQDEHIDLGQVDDGPIFTESVGVGIDSEAWSLAPEQEPVGIWRWLTGIRLGLTTLSTFNPQQIRITVDGQPIVSQLMQVTVANARFFGAGIQMAPHARLQDGLLDVCLIPLMSKMQLLASLPLFFSGRHLDRIPDVVYHQGREIEISARREAPVRVDGVIGGRLPIRIRVLPRALGIRLPRRAESSQDLCTI
jgi:YegS/Rv2252/BmrU family lipid kinase